jgi:putative transposase
MPDHVHLLLTPSPEIALEKAMQLIKGGFSFQLKSQHEVWTRSFNEHRIQTPHDYQRHIVYIEQNPIRARLAENPQDYKFSSLSLQDLTDPCPSWLSSPTS